MPPTGLFIGLIVLVIAAIAGFIVIHTMQLHREAAQAQVVANKVIQRLDKQDVAGIRTLADKKFQADNSADKLEPLVKPIAQIYGNSTPVVDQTVVSNTDKAQYVTFIYKYGRLKVPFYVRVGMSRPNGTGTWHLVNLGANLDESQL